MRIDPDREDGRVVEIIQLASSIPDNKAHRENDFSGCHPPVYTFDTL